MHIIVLGAGVTGITSAWYLRQAGHEVTVIDRQPAAGLETSFANGGQVSVSHAEPWANPGAPAKVLKWLMKEDAPLLFRLRADPAQWRWGLAFLRECAPGRTARNIRSMVSLGLYSRAKLRELRAATGLQYEQRTQGILHFYTSEAEYAAAQEPARIMREQGCELDMKTPEECVAIEPALAQCRDKIVGGSMTPSDESGDAHRFTQELARRCVEAGVQFRYETRILGCEREGDAVSQLITADAAGRVQRLRADAYVLCMGSFSRGFARELGVDLNIYPAKGYSVTLPVIAPEHSYQVSLTDDEYKLVFSRLGDRLRIAGTAELNGYDTSLNLARCEAIVRRTRELFPQMSDGRGAQFWTGLRPATPSNVPYIGRSRLRNLFLNTGHGTLGWTHGCGSGAAIADIVSGRQPELDFAFTGLEAGTPSLRPQPVL
ncbi:MAG: D-amino acid dehydrogenase [Roseateles asaccharophilus]|uniref:D-amino-acid dehydrogenase n=1 Tax=Roseateles asaccharophilus TaxID=582607 RepID=A0A4V3CIB7_9BURK|nr:D-amino acid dehydrogenase [Roseateles asaccharophilus]MDN3546334.1 D-amino acid dehydrogenase [Roseateles asaccharophilus]TDP04953.1 D-amino-acid dehydrogenase [Roseateles asaccharophilus]